MKKIQLLLIALIIAGSAFAQQKVSGIVYEDLNANGKKERREKGLPNIAVSNGIQVVQTDKNGKYELPLAEDQTIFVIKPASHELPTDTNNIPQFYYIHKPNGSPANLKFPGVVPTGKLPKSVDFGLLPDNTDKKFTALIFGDPQPYTLKLFKGSCRSCVFRHCWGCFGELGGRQT